MIPSLSFSLGGVHPINEADIGNYIEKPEYFFKSINVLPLFKTYVQIYVLYASYH